MRGVANYERIYMVLRAAALPRIKHAISMPTSYWGNRKATQELVVRQRRPSSIFDWCITQGMHITGTTTP